jgi:hypothetical protein
MIFADYFFEKFKKLDIENRKKKSITKIVEYHNYLFLKRKEEAFRKFGPY